MGPAAASATGATVAPGVVLGGGTLVAPAAAGATAAAVAPTVRLASTAATPAAASARGSAVAPAVVVATPTVAGAVVAPVRTPATTLVLRAGAPVSVRAPARGVPIRVTEPFRPLVAASTGLVVPAAASATASAVAPTVRKGSTVAAGAVASSTPSTVAPSIPASGTTVAPSPAASTASALLGAALGGGAAIGGPSIAVIDTPHTNNESADGTWWPAVPTFTVDQNGKWLASVGVVGQGVRWIYSNDQGVVWNDATVSGIAFTRCGSCYDPTTSTLHVLASNDDAAHPVTYRRYTVTRSGTAITGLTLDGSSLVLDTGASFYEHPQLLFCPDIGSNGAILAVWGAVATGGTGAELRASMRVLSNTSADFTAGNWAAPVSAATPTISPTPAVAYSILYASGSDTKAPAAATLRKRTSGANPNDVYVFYGTGTSSGGTYRWRRMRWNAGSSNWSTGLTTDTQICPVIRAGGGGGWSQKQQNGSRIAWDPAGDYLFWGMATYKDDTSKECWEVVRLDAADALSSIATAYAANAYHSYLPCGDLLWDATASRLIVAYNRSTTQDYCVKLLTNALAVDQGETVVWNTTPIDIPLLVDAGGRVGGRTPVWLRSQDLGLVLNPPYRGYYGTLGWPSAPSGSSPTTAADAFNRAAPLGSNWTSMNGTPTITSNAFAGGAAGENAAFWATATNTFSADQFSQATIAFVDGSTECGLYVRASGSGGTRNGYLAVFGDSSVNVYARVAGAATLLGSSISRTNVAGDVMRMTINGTTLSVYANGTRIFQVTDASIATGQPGLYAWSTAREDDWSGGNLR